MNTFLGGIRGTNDRERITPALNEKVVKRAKEIVTDLPFVSQKEWIKAYRMAIKEFGYSVAYYEKELRRF